MMRGVEWEVVTSKRSGFGRGKKWPRGSPARAKSNRVDCFSVFQEGLSPHDLRGCVRKVFGVSKSIQNPNRDTPH